MADYVFCTNLPGFLPNEDPTEPTEFDSDMEALEAFFDGLRYWADEEDESTDAVYGDYAYSQPSVAAHVGAIIADGAAHLLHVLTSTGTLSVYLEDASGWTIAHTITREN